MKRSINNNGNYSVKRQAENRSLRETLKKETILCAEGYLFELERRGYLQAGVFAPTVLLEYPDVVRQLHLDFARAGSDVMEALTYYANPEKLRVLGMEDRFEEMNQVALTIAGEVAKEYDTWFAGNICNTNIYQPDKPIVNKEIRAIFDQQVAWASQAGVDYIIGETFGFLGEALIALEAIKAANIEAVITLTAGKNDQTHDGYSFGEAAKRLEQRGADVVGVNCHRGPEMIKPLVHAMRKAVDIPIAALPVPYRTSTKTPSFMALQENNCPCDIPTETAFPVALDPFTCNRFEVSEFAKEMKRSNINYIGLCCGAGPHHIRAMAEALGRSPETGKYSPDMSKHVLFGTDSEITGKAADKGLY